MAAVIDKNKQAPDMEELAPQESQDIEETTPTPDGAQNTEPGPIPYNRFKEVNERAKQLEAQLAEIEDQRKRKQQEEALAAGRYQDVINELQPLAQEATKLREVAQGLLDIELSNLPEDVIPLVEAVGEDLYKRLEFVRSLKASSLLSKAKTPQAPVMDEGKRGEQPARHNITEKHRQQAALARWAGYEISAEELAKYDNKG